MVTTSASLDCSSVRTIAHRALVMAAVCLAPLPFYGLTSRSYIWPDCDTSHPCVVHHIDTVSDGTASGETLQDFKFPMVPSSAGNLLIFTVTHVSAKSLTVSDNNGGNWQTGVSTTNAVDGETTEVRYICGAAAGTNLITIHLSQAAAHDEVLQFSYSEVSGIAPSSCLDGASGANGLVGTVRPGAIATNADGDLIYNFGEETYTYPEYDDPISGIVADSNSAMLMENTFDKFASQVSVQATHGSYNPTLTVNGDSNARMWNSVAAAFKAASGAGTQPTGIHVTRILHYLNATGSRVQVPFPSTGNAIVLSTSNPSDGWNMANLTDNLGDTYTRIPFPNSSTDPQIYYTCLGSVTGARDLTISWDPASLSTHLIIYEIAGAKTTGGSTGCVGNTVNDITGEQPSSADASISGDPIITPSASNSLIITTSYIGLGPPSASLTPNAVFNSIWATGMIDPSHWDTGDPFAYIYTNSTNPISFDWDMANSAEAPNGGTYYDGAAIEILAEGAGGQSTLRSIATSPKSATLSSGANQQFTATGTNSDGSTLDETNSATWSSSSPSVASISSGGLASGLCAGSTTITASMSNVSGQSTLTVTGLSITSTSVSSSANPSPSGQSVTFTARVTSSCGAPAGSVQFTVDNANYGSPVALSGGTASFSAALASGSHTIVAVYSGNASFSGSSSSALTETVGSGCLPGTSCVTNATAQFQPTAYATLVATYPCNAGNKGQVADVSDSTVRTWGAAITTGGGSYDVLARCGGTNWTVLGY
jgi:hypothetical protein